MTQEEKAKAYDVALEKIRKGIQPLQDGSKVSGVTRGFLEEVFPELKESEDERIRKAIIAFFELEDDNTTYSLVPKKDILTWLEKQGEQPKKVSIWKHWKDGIAGNGEGTPVYLIKYGYTYSISSCLSFECDYIELSELDKLLSEKQGEPTEINPSEFDLRLNKLLKQFESLPKEELISNLSYYLNVIKNDGTYKIEKQGEESITIDTDPVASYNNVMISDKIEPKFKVGDWINGYYTNYKVLSVNNKGWYVVEDVDGNKMNILFENEKFHHLWTISDAKDGDVLVHNGCTFIFMGIKNGVVQALEENLFDGANPVSFGEPDKDNDYYPATKEQRDILFQKMKEAGYEWNPTRKELKEIKQKPAWSEEDERLCQCLIKDQKEALDNVSNDKYGHSEIISDLKEMYYERIDWLKSLKERIGG